MEELKDKKIEIINTEQKKNIITSLFNEDEISKLNNIVLDELTEEVKEMAPGKFLRHLRHYTQNFTNELNDLKRKLVLKEVRRII